MKGFVYISVLFLLCGACWAEDFTVNIVGTGHYGFHSLDVDGNGEAVILKSVGPDHPLYFLRESDHFDPVELPDSLDGEYPSVDITSNNETAVCYVRNNTLWYGQKGSWYEWTNSMIPGSTGAAVPVMKLGPGDVPYIAYASIPGNNLMCCHFDVQSGQWVHEFVMNTPQVIFRPFIDIADDGRVMVGISDMGYNKTRVAIKVDGGWTYLPFIEGIRADGEFTSDGKPSAAVMDGNMLYYGVYINEIIGWERSTVENMYSNNFYVTLGQSSGGKTGLAVINFSTQTLTYHSNTGGWTTTVIEDYGALTVPELVFDNDDKPLISYGGHYECMGTLVTKLAGVGIDYFSMADLDYDAKVDLHDYSIFAENWLGESYGEESLLSGDFDGNGIVDLYDFKWFLCFWMGGCN
jgi:hypothetical protein